MYLTFLLDLAGGGDNRAVKATVRYEPTKQKPKNAFSWSVTCDVHGTVVVRGHHRGRYRVIGSGRWEGDALTDRRQIDTTPTDYQWALVEKAIRGEIARAHGGFADDPSWVERFDPTALKTREEYKELVRPTARVRRRGVRLFVFGTFVAIALVIFGVHQCLRDQPTPIATPPAATPRLVPDAAPSPSLAPDLATAIAQAKPSFLDSVDPLAGGATLLAQYAGTRMRWSELGGVPETTIGHVLRDPDVERGKRLCATGTIDHIERRDVDGRKVYVGRMTTANADAIAFAVAGSVGDIVKRSPASMCGVVTGATSNTVTVVGMFDLAENRAPLVESER